MTTQRLLLVYGVTALVISVPFTVVHLTARPDDAPITPVQHVVAAAANYLGPWGVGVVQWVDFPNAGLRSFRWLWAVGMTLLGAVLVQLATRVRRPLLQVVLAVVWGLFVVAWFGLGLLQIADGLL